MADPLSLISLGAAIGGATGKFVEKAWDSGEKWIITYFENHHEKSQKNAKQNTLSFLTDLAKRVEQLEKEQKIAPERIIASQEHPDFSVVLKKAMISASQTDSQDKHELLSRLVAERIQAKPESIIALASKMACDAISCTTYNQLKILSLITNILYISPTSDLSEEQYLVWLKKRIDPFIAIRATNLDYFHLESLSCLKIAPFLSGNLKNILSQKNQGRFDYDTFKEQKLGKLLIEIWENQNLRVAQLTSTGQIIGVMVSEKITGAKTSMIGWER